MYATAKIALQDCVWDARVARSLHSLRATSSTVQRRMSKMKYHETICILHAVGSTHQQAKLIRLLLAQDISFIRNSSIYDVRCFVHSPHHVLNQVCLDSQQICSTSALLEAFQKCCNPPKSVSRHWSAPPLSVENLF